MVAQEFQDWIKYLGVFTSALLWAYFLTPMAIRFGLKFGLVDIPNEERRIHTTAIPRSGGIAVFLAFHVGALLAFEFFWPDFRGGLNETWWISFLIASSVLLVVGIVDDRCGLRPIVKLLGQIAAACILFFLTDKGFGTLLGYNLPWIFDLALTVFWTVAIVNAFNLIDGLDGLCSGLAIISAIGLAGSFMIRGMLGDAMIVLAFIGATLGFLRYNFHPAKIFLGDTGSMFLGFAMASMALHTNGKSTLVVTLGIPLLAAGVPVMDTALAIWRRSIRKVLAKKSGQDCGKIMGADRAHIHHRLLDSGLTQRKVALAMYALNGLLVLLGLLFLASSQFSLGAFLVLFFVFVYVVVRHIVHVEVWDTGRVLIAGLKESKRQLFAFAIYPIWDVVFLVFAYIMSGWLVKGSEFLTQDFHRLLGSAILWMGPVFIFLAGAKSYQRQWRKAGFRDYFLLTLALWSGVCVAVLLKSTINVEIRRPDVLHGLLFCFVGQIGILGARATVQILREWMVMSAFENKTGSHYEPTPTLVYGAGNCGGLYMRELRLMNPDILGRKKIYGFIDDNIGLRKRLVYGLPVLGNSDEIDHLVQDLEIQEIIVTCDLDPPQKAALLAIKQKYNLRVHRWEPVLREFEF